jgi:hypothetical protein
MPTPRTVTYEYSAAPDVVAALLRDPEFLKSRSEQAGDKNVEVRLEELGDGLRVVVARDKEVDLPSFAKRMFQPKNRITDDVRWRREGERWVAEYTLDISGVPGEVKGRSTLAPSAEGCTHELHFEVTARVPLVGGRLESFVADRVAETFREHAVRNAQRLK